MPFKGYFNIRCILSGFTQERPQHQEYTSVFFRIDAKKMQFTFFPE